MLPRFELLTFIFQYPEKFSGAHYPATKPSRDRVEVPLVKSHDRMCLPVDGGFQDHIVIRIGQRGPPAKRERHAFAHERQAIENVRDLFSARPRRRQMLWPAQNGLILQHQRH